MQTGVPRNRVVEFDIRNQLYESVDNQDNRGDGGYYQTIASRLYAYLGPVLVSLSIYFVGLWLKVIKMYPVVRLSLS